MSDKSKIGLFGYGCVGQGLHDVLNNSKGFTSEISKIVVKDKTKKRRLNPDVFVYDKSEILLDKDVNLVVELIDDADAAYHIVKQALINGKDVVSANKKLIAENYEELVGLQEKHNVALLYEASCCGSIPIIRNLEEYYDNELLNSVSGIFNGSSNYILSKVINDGQDYDQALVQAQALGFAESDPTLDVGGYDAKYKLVIISGHAYGVFIKPEQVFNYGIQNLKPEDIEFAKKNNYKIKLIATVQKIDDNKISAFVIPQFVDADNLLYNVENEFNGVTVEAAFSEKQLFIGKGAGGHPTGSAVLSDISANSYNYRYEYKKSKQKGKYIFSNNVKVEVYARFNSEETIGKLKFENIKEKGNGFIVGSVALTDLIEQKETLEKEGVFIASTGEVNALHTVFKNKEKALVNA